MGSADETALDDFDVARGAGVRRAMCVADDQNFGVEAVTLEFKQRDGAEACLFVVEQVGAARVNEDDAIAVFKAFDVGVAGDDDVGREPGKVTGDDLGDWSVFAAEVVSHGDRPTLDLEQLAILEAGIIEDIVVAPSSADGGELLHPVENGRSRDVATVED